MLPAYRVLSLFFLASSLSTALAAEVANSTAGAPSRIEITSDFGKAAGNDDVLVIEKPNVSVRVYRTTYGTTVVFENGLLHGP